MPVRAEPAYEDLPVQTFSKTRDISAQLHSYLRHLIIDNVLPAGTPLNQADLARRLGVSRIPMREASRMLQQEGLIDVQRNQRATIRQLTAQELDSLYGARIVLESLAVRMTCGRLTDEEHRTATQLLPAMGEAVQAGDIDRWIVLHREFHALCTARADEPLYQLIRSLSERTERYLRLAQHAHPEAFASAQRGHQEILDAIHEGDPSKGGALMGEHLSHTARMILPDLHSDEAQTSVDNASAMAAGGKLRARPRKR